MAEIFDSADHTYYLPLYNSADGKITPNRDLLEFFRIIDSFRGVESATNQITPSNVGPTRVRLERFQTFIAGWDGWEGAIKVVKRGRNSVFVRGRAVLVKCFDGRFVSLTLRRTGKSIGKHRPQVPSHAAISLNDEDAIGKGTYSLEAQKRQSAPDGFAVDMRQLADLLYELIFPRETEYLPNGIIVFSASTKSGKSQLTRALVRRILASPLAQSSERRPHLLTFEDPIEALFSAKPESAQKIGIDYTPRALGRVSPDSTPRGPVHDCRNLEEGLRNALRMTPRVVYIGEMRDRQDWKHLLEFASTGHLALTTTHGGSLTETVKSILDVAKATTPAARGNVAEKLLAVVHLKPMPISLAWPHRAPACRESEFPMLALLPQLWRRKASSIAALVADGVSAIQPVRPLPQDEQNTTCFSRVWFVERLLKNRWQLREELSQKARMMILRFELSGL